MPLRTTQTGVVNETHTHAKPHHHADTSILSHPNRCGPRYGCGMDIFSPGACAGNPAVPTHALSLNGGTLDAGLAAQEAN
jgi:hypothetical protein